MAKQESDQKTEQTKQLVQQIVTTLRPATEKQPENLVQQLATLMQAQSNSILQAVKNISASPASIDRPSRRHRSRSPPSKSKSSSPSGQCMTPDEELQSEDEQDDHAPKDQPEQPVVMSAELVQSLERQLRCRFRDVHWSVLRSLCIAVGIKYQKKSKALQEFAAWLLSPPQ